MHPAYIQQLKPSSATRLSLLFFLTTREQIVFAAGAHAWDPNEGGIANNKRIFSDSVKELATLAAKEGKVDRFVLVSSGGVTHYEDYSESLADCLKCVENLVWD
jgi:hypothetical protein